MQERRKYEQNTENLCRGARSRGAEMDKKVESKKMTARAPPMVAQTTMTQFFIFIFQFMIALIRKWFFLFMSWLGCVLYSKLAHVWVMGERIELICKDLTRVLIFSALHCVRAEGKAGDLTE